MVAGTRAPLMAPKTVLVQVEMGKGRASAGRTASGGEDRAGHQAWIRMFSWERTQETGLGVGKERH